MIDLDAALDELIATMERANKAQSFKALIKKDPRYAGRGQQEYLRLRGVADVMGLRVIEETSKKYDGRAYFGQATLAIDHNTVGVRRVWYFAHELAHFVLHDSNFGGERQSSKLMEVEAGAVAYLVTRALGYNWINHSAWYCISCGFKYHWDGLPKIKKSRERIFAGTRSILEDLVYVEQRTSAATATVAAGSRERQHQHK